jgi:excisionase family DNA binding protein
MSDPAAVPALPRLLTARELADATGLPAWRISELCRSDAIPHVRLGRAVRFNASAIAAWLEAGGTRQNAERES